MILKLGVVGGANTRWLLGGGVRLLDRPLALLIQSASAAKSSLMDAVLDLARRRRGAVFRMSG
jgi:hypothetical protein